MPYRRTVFVNDNVYHVFNRGVNKQNIFSNHSDYAHFNEILEYYQYLGPKPSFSIRKRFKINTYKNNPKIVNILSYCFMPNHFHFILQQCIDGGVQEFIRKALNSYTKYFNAKYKRVGHLLQAEFKAVTVETDEQLLHLSRYIHLNPYASGLTDDFQNYPYSSYRSFLGLQQDNLCSNDNMLQSMLNKNDYKQFVEDQKDYARKLDQIKHLTFDES